MIHLYDQSDAKPEVLRNERIAILGYGSQGRAHALNLRDAGFNVVLGLRPGGKSFAQAKSDGWSPVPMAEAVQGAGVVAMLMPDMAQPKCWETSVKPNLKSGALLLFAHGFAIHFKRIEPGEDVDVGLVAPKSPGALVRREFEQGQGVPCLMAVWRDASGKAHDKTLAYAHGIGGTRAGVLETTFAEETETDLFGEQAVLCGGATELITAGFETLVEAGYQPEVAYFECLHELKLIVDLLHEGGLARMHKFVSETAIYGDLSRGPRIIDAGTKERMKQVLTEIQTGEFAREWIAEDAAGKPNYNKKMEADLAHPIEVVGKKLRARMAWLSDGSDKDEEAA